MIGSDTNMIVRECIRLPCTTPRAIATTVFEQAKYFKTSTVYDIMKCTVPTMIAWGCNMLPCTTTRSIATTVFEPPKFSKTYTVYEIIKGTVTR